MPPRFPAALPLLAAALVVAPSAANAQVVQGRVTEAGAAIPVAGAIVLLLDEHGARRGATLADTDGTYRLQAPAAGTYRLRVERVGYASTTSDPLRLQAGQTVEWPLQADARRVMLDPVVATGSARRCAGRLHQGAQAATVWAEARKAVLSATLAAESGRYRFVTETRERELGLNGRRLTRDRVVRDTSVGLPFRSRHVHALLRNGYVILTPQQVHFHGVDAAAILSDAFLEHHCFGLREGGAERPGLVGLEFVPLEGRVRPDVRGVLWVDRATMELRYVEYTYTGVHARGPVQRLSGRLDFTRLRNGVWVTENWNLVIPVLMTESIRSGPGLDGYRITALVERGGRVLEMQDLAATDW